MDSYGSGGGYGGGAGFGGAGRGGGPRGGGYGVRDDYFQMYVMCVVACYQCQRSHIHIPTTLGGGGGGGYKMS